MNTYSKLWRNTSFMQLIMTLFLVEFVRGALLISFIPKFAVSELQLSVGVVGAAISAHYVADTLAKTAIGYLLDRYSIRLVVPAGLFLALIGFLFLLNAFHHPWLFIVAFALYGLGISPVWIVCLASISDEDRASQSGVLYGVWLVGLGAGSFLVNLYMESKINVACWLLIVILGLSWVSSFFLAELDKTTRNHQSFSSQLAQLWNRMKFMKLLLPGMLLQSVGASLLVPVIPLFIDHDLELTPTVYSYMLLIGGGSAALGLFSFAKWIAMLGNKLVLSIGFVGFALALILLAQKPPFLIILMAAMILGFSYSAVMPAWNTLIAQFIPPSQAATGWGAISAVEGIGIMFGPILGGMLALHYNLVFPLVFSACLFTILGCFYYLRYPKLS
jgi:MFS family permease